MTQTRVQFSRNKFKGKCNTCGVWGHKSSNCFEHAKNAHLRPNGWRSRTRGKGKKELSNMAHGSRDDDEDEDNHFIVGLAAIHEGNEGNKNDYGGNSNVYNEDGKENCEDNSHETSIYDYETEVEDSDDDSMPGQINQVEPETSDDSSSEEEESLFHDDSDTESVSDMSYAFSNMDEALDYMQEYTKNIYNIQDIDEIAAACLESSVEASLLKGEDLWIADSGCTTHMTPHKIGFQKIKHRNERVTMANGNVEGSNIVGQVVGNKVDMDGNFEHRLIINDVSHTPGGIFNLFSTGTMIKKGWLLYGSKAMLWLQNGNKRINFDIKVETSKGTLYCMRVMRDGIKTHMTRGRTKLEDKGTSDVVTKDVSTKFSEMKVVSEKNDDVNKELPKLYNPKCYKCGRNGHKSLQCKWNQYPQKYKAGEGQKKLELEAPKIARHYVVKDGKMNLTYGLENYTADKQMGKKVKDIREVLAEQKVIDRKASEIAEDMMTTCNLPGDDIDDIFNDDYTMIYQRDALITKMRFPCNGEVMTEFRLRQGSIGKRSEISCAGLTKTSNQGIQQCGQWTK